VGNGPQAIVFDGRNMWVANSADKTVTELWPDGGTVNTFPAANGTYGMMAFDGLHMWLVNYNGASVTEL
jgi:hypothetical protein